MSNEVFRARNGIDLGEGTQLLPGENATAVLFCSVPKSQINLDSYVGEAVWTMNTGDPDFGKQEIRFECEAITEQGGPLYGNGQGRYRSLGCYKENNPGRQLESQLYGSTTTTNEKCIQDCFNHAKKYIYAGTQYHRECWCGNKLPTLKVGNEDCNFDCTGNSTQLCGGNGYFGGGSYISLFGDSERHNNSTQPPTSTTTSTGPSVTPTAAPTPTHNPGNEAFDLAGCYREPTSGGRALQTLGRASNEMTVALCLTVCASYEYAGLEYSRECWCGNTLSVNALPVPQTECKNLCVGNPNEYCGSGGRLSLYRKKKDNVSSVSSVSSTVSTTPIESTDTATNPQPTTAVPTPTGPSIHPGTAGFTHIGCYTEATTGRALGLKSLATDAMTVPMCIDFCSAYQYAGIEYGRECWCGNTFAAGAVLATPQTQCSMLCKGDTNYYCGAGRRLNVYEKGV